MPDNFAAISHSVEQLVILLQSLKYSDQKAKVKLRTI